MAESFIPLAHAGHLLIDLPVFMGPIMILVGWLLFVILRERRRDAAGAGRTDQAERGNRDKATPESGAHRHVSAGAA